MSRLAGTVRNRQGITPMNQTESASNQGRLQTCDSIQCTKCKRMLPRGQFQICTKTICGLQSWCKECNRVKNLTHYSENKTTERARRKKWYDANRPRVAARCKKYIQRLRLQVLTAYGGKCVCCGEDNNEFLAIDHPENDGRIDRVERGLTGRQMYLHLIRADFPKDRYRILCHNCNMARALYGYCPHEKRKV